MPSRWRMGSALLPLKRWREAVHHSITSACACVGRGVASGDERADAAMTHVVMAQLSRGGRCMWPAAPSHRIASQPARQRRQSRHRSVEPDTTATDFTGKVPPRLHGIADGGQPRAAGIAAITTLADRFRSRQSASQTGEDAGTAVPRPDGRGDGWEGWKGSECSNPKHTFFNLTHAPIVRSAMCRRCCRRCHGDCGGRRHRRGRWRRRRWPPRRLPLSLRCRWE